MRILIFAALSVGPTAPAFAQDAVIDPGPDTPAGTQYQIPFDTARQDAAPHPKAPKRHNGTTLQSENGFGSSSQVPGATAPPVAARPVPAATPAERTRRGAGKRRRHSGPAATRKRATKRVTTPAPATPQPVATTPAPSSAPPASASTGGWLILLLGSVVAAGGAGSAARRRP